jgi:hypothetical protein
MRVPDDMDSSAQPALRDRQHRERDRVPTRSEAIFQVATTPAAIDHTDFIARDVNMPRARGPMTFRTVRAIGLKLPGVEEGTMYGSPALKLRGAMIACMTSHKSAERNTLAVRADDAQRDALIAEAPEIYYVKPHYEGYSVVLVRLSRVSPDAMRDLLAGACRLMSATGKKRSTRR